jgi:hypothetical protein
MKLKVLVLSIMAVALVGLMGASAPQCNSQQAQTVDVAFSMAVVGLQMAYPYGEAAVKKQCADKKWDATQCKMFNDNIACLESSVNNLLPMLGPIITQAMVDDPVSNKKLKVKLSPAKTSELFMKVYSTLTLEQKQAVKTAINAEK